MEGDEEQRGGERRTPGAGDEDARRHDPETAAAATRSSVVPSPPPSSPAKGNYRLLFAVLWIAVQATLIVTAGRRSDGAFGFRMFNESSTIELTLYRELEHGADAPHASGEPRVRARVEGGVWTARARDGTNHRVSFYDRVRTPFWVFDRAMPASYGATAQLERLQLALDHLAAHLSTAEDVETRRFVLDVTVRRNGRGPIVHQLTSREREGWPPHPHDGAP